MVSTILGIMIGIAIGACIGNDNIRSKIMAMINKQTAPKKPVKSTKKSTIKK